MILDHLDRAYSYASFHRRFSEAFDFLRNAEWQSIEDGRHLIEGDDLYVLVSSDQGRGRENSALEVHRRFIDIQFVIAGNEVIGWRSVTTLRDAKTPFDGSRDIGFFSEQPESWFIVSPGSFAIFFPTDAHAPLAGSAKVRKAVVKVPV